MTYAELLKSLGACEEAVQARRNSTIEESLAEARRGDWLLWLASKLGLDKRKLTLAKARCARTVGGLMRDPRSLKAVEVAEQYGLGLCDETALQNAAADAAYATAADAAYATAAAYAAYAAYATAADAADAAAYATAAAAAYATAAADAAEAARQQNQRQTALICIEIFGDDLITAVNLRLKTPNKEQSQ